MGYFTSTRNGWFELNDFNMSGTGPGGYSYDIDTTGTWISVARFDNDDIDMCSAIYRSAIQTDGVTSLFTSTDPSGTALLSMRILPPNSNVGLSVFSNLGITGSSAIGVTEGNFIPSRSIPRNSLLQAKMDTYKGVDFSGTNNRLYLRFNFTYNGVDPQITSLLDY